MRIDVINMFWDLDGVIFKYEKSAYYGDKPAYAEPGYFRKREIDYAAYSLLEYVRDNGNTFCNINILSRGATRLDETKRRNIIEDKRMNVAEAIPWLSRENVIITELPKVDEAIKFLHRPLSKQDILIDDFNENLISWKNAGGIAIKYLNGLNSSETYDGPKIKNGILIDVPNQEEHLYKRVFM